VGSGQFGKVCRAIHLPTQAEYAIKIINCNKFKIVPKLYQYTLNEIRALSKINHPNIIRFKEQLKTSHNVYLIYEFCNGGTLEQQIKEQRYLPEAEALRFLR